MIGYTLKHILDLIPEALGLVKQASIEKEYPTGSKDDCLASGLVLAYKAQVSGQRVDYDDMVKVANAVTAYGLDDKVKELTQTMVFRNQDRLTKQASAETPEVYMVKQANFEGNLTGFVDLAKISDEASELVQKAAELGVKPSEEVLRYSGNLFLAKEAALGALGARFYATKNDTFVKIAAALSKEAEFIPPGRLVKNLCETVTGLDKEAGLLAKGFNFYKETLVKASAAADSMTVCVSGQNYPLQKILNMPASYVDDYLGKDFMKEVNSDPASAKAMIETLPMDTQHVLATILKNAN